jgi:hypothetical protein
MRYYYNKSLRLSQYELPEGADSPPLPPPRSQPRCSTAKVQEVAEMQQHQPATAATSSISTATSSSPSLLSPRSHVATAELHQLQSQIARLSAMMPFLQGETKAEAAGDIAACNLRLAQIWDRDAGSSH